MCTVPSAGPHPKNKAVKRQKGSEKMSEIALRTNVIIKQNQLPGEIRARWIAVDMPEKYLVRYVDSTGRIAEDWLALEDFDLAKA